eukprot:747454-Pyramimonas_sp.AAC.1
MMKWPAPESLTTPSSTSLGGPADFRQRSPPSLVCSQVEGAQVASGSSLSPPRARRWAALVL